MNDVKCPQIENLQKITPEQAAEYVRFVATMRHNQNRWFRLRNVDALHIAQDMEGIGRVKRIFVGPDATVVLI